MREKLKSSKGITLVALIITIIVLLILAVVAIQAVQGDGIINHAKNASASYKEATVNEQETLDEMFDKIGELTSKKWWEITSEELSAMPSEDGAHIVAWNGLGSQNGGKYVFLNPNGTVGILFQKYESNNYSEEKYVYILSEELAGEVFESPTKDNLYKWYKINDGTTLEYTGESPIQKSDFTEIYSETYLQKVIDSFGK